MQPTPTLNRLGLLIMSRNTETPAAPSNFPVIALLILNLLAVLFTLGAVLARTAGLKGAPEKVAMSADRVGDIRVVEDTVVFDLIDVNDQGKNPQVTKQITMPHDGFLSGFASMEQLVQQMVDKGDWVAVENEADPGE